MAHHLGGVALATRTGSLVAPLLSFPSVMTIIRSKIVVTSQNTVQTADSHVHALRQQTLLIHFGKTPLKPSIIMSEGRPTLDALRTAKQTVRTQRGNRQVWTLIYGEVLPLESVHAILDAYFSPAANWLKFDLAGISLKSRKGGSR